MTPVARLRTRFRPRQRPRYAGPSFNRMIPNILTMVGLCAGLSSMRYALEGRFGPAAVAIVVAGCIDGLDGRLARLLKATSRFGAEFDSLTDFCAFGVAPAFVLYLWSLQSAGGFGFTPCLIFAVCMALRLARGWTLTAKLTPPFDSLMGITGTPCVGRRWRCPSARRLSLLQWRLQSRSPGARYSQGKHHRQR